MLQQDIIRVIFEFTATKSFHCRYINVNIAKFKNSKNKKKKSCDQNDGTIWSHDLTKIEFWIIKRLIAFEIFCGDVDSLVIFVIINWMQMI